MVYEMGWELSEMASPVNMLNAGFIKMLEPHLLLLPFLFLAHIFFVCHGVEYMDALRIGKWVEGGRASPVNMLKVKEGKQKL